MKTTEPRADIVVLCEDVREEVGRKHTLVGVYSADILVASLPASVRLALYFALWFPASGTHAFKVRMSYAGKEAGEFNGEIPTDRDGTVSIVVPPFLANFDREGDWKVELDLGHGWTEVINKHISVGPVHLTPILAPAS